MNNSSKPACFCCVIFTLCLYLFLSITIIPAGNVGVVDVFGNLYEQPLPSGLSFVNPLARIIKYSVKTQILDLDEGVPTREGLTVHLEVAALIALEPSHAVKMYRTVGEEYIPTIVTAQFRSIIREVTSGHDAKDLYGAATRIEMTRDIKRMLHEIVNRRGLIVQEIVIKKLELPKGLQMAIEDKLQAEQAAQKMQFVLDRERQEADRKSIEAGGIAEFQRVVSGEISEGMLRWKGIEATEQLIRAPNTRIVIYGNDQSGLPVILNSHEDIHRSWNRNGYQNTSSEPIRPPSSASNNNVLSVNN